MPVPKEKYKLSRTVPIVIKFPIDIDDEYFDKLRSYLYDIFPISMVEQQSSKIVIILVPEGMTPAAEDIKKSLTVEDVIVDDQNYNLYVERA